MSSLLDRIKGAKAKYSRSGGDTFKLKEGKTRLRIIPFLGPNGKVGEFPDGGDGRFYADVAVHWIKTSLNGKPVAVVGDCEHVYGRPSAINEAIAMAAEVAKKTDDEMVKLVSEWKSRKSVLINAVVRDKADGSADHLEVVELTPTTWGKVMSTLETYMEDAEDPESILSLDNGIDFIIERTGKNLDTDYGVMAAPTSKPVKKDVLDKIADLDDFIAAKYFRGEEQKAITAIQAVTGIAKPRLAIGSRPANALLTSRAEQTAVTPAPQTKVVEAPATEVTEAPTAPVAPAPALNAAAPATAPESFGEPLAESDVDALLSELDNL